MDSLLRHDLDQLPQLLSHAAAVATRHLTQIDSTAPVSPRPPRPTPVLPTQGLGAAGALQHFVDHLDAHMAASPGPRYWGFVTGGTTPAALIGDWLVSAYDTNLADRQNSAAPAVELEAVDLLRQLFGLPLSFGGVFVSGATMSNMVGLALGREWVARQQGHDSAGDGLYGLPPIKVLSAAPHSSTIKAMAMLGMGRKHVQAVAKLPGNREAVDPADLARQLAALNGQPCIVVANAGTVNTVDFDDLRAVAALREQYPFWLHVDGAFGGFAACSPQFRHLLDGLEQADSFTVDGHKWLNVPYDSAMIFTRHPSLQTHVFQNAAAYLPDLGAEPDFFHLTPENSRRFRALPAWFTLMAYGRAGYQEIVERNCRTAAQLGERISASGAFRLLAPVRMNVVCFTLRDVPEAELSARIKTVLAVLAGDGRLFVTPTIYQGVPGIRAALCNWRTEDADLDLGWAALEAAARHG
jgi:glutamate/tyrosine decarboxylase-like PLP-dependent enzyme